jgi:hypothetical protein
VLMGSTLSLLFSILAFKLRPTRPAI